MGDFLFSVQLDAGGESDQQPELPVEPTGYVLSLPQGFLSPAVQGRPATEGGPPHRPACRGDGQLLAWPGTGGMTSF